MFYEIYSRLCSEKGVSPSRAAVDMGFYRSSVSYWKNKGGSPGRDGLRKMSEYFGVSIETFTKEERETRAKATEEKAYKPPEDKNKTGADMTNRNTEYFIRSQQQIMDIVPGDGRELPGDTGGAVPDHEDLFTENQNRYFAGKRPVDPNPGMRKKSFSTAMELAKALDYIGDIKHGEPEDIGGRIKLLRKQQGFSVEYVAKVAGVDKKTYLMWESGETKDIRRYKLGRLAKILGTTIDHLAGKDSIPESIKRIDELDIKPFIELLETRGECLALLLMARDMSREDVELTISFMRSLKAETE